jgi:hypothetical protein
VYLVGLYAYNATDVAVFEKASLYI